MNDIYSQEGTETDEMHGPSTLGEPLVRENQQNAHNQPNQSIEFLKRASLEFIADMNAILPAQYSAAFMLGIIYSKNLSVYEIKEYLHYLIKGPMSLLATPFMLGAFLSNRNIAKEYLPGTVNKVVNDILPSAGKGLIDIIEYLTCSYQKKEHTWKNSSYSLDTIDEENGRRISITFKDSPRESSYSIGNDHPALSLSGSESFDYTQEVAIIRYFMKTGDLKKSSPIPTPPMRHDLALASTGLALTTAATYIGLALHSSVAGRTFIPQEWAAFGWAIDIMMIVLYVLVSTITRINGTYGSLQRRELYTSYCSNPSIRNVLDFYEHFRYRASALPAEQLNEILDDINDLRLSHAIETFYESVPRQAITFSSLEPKAWPRLILKGLFAICALAAVALFYDIGFDLMSTITGITALCATLSFISTIPHELLYLMRLPFIYDEIVNHYYWQRHAAATKNIDTEPEKNHYAMRKTAQNSISSLFSWCNLAGPGWAHGQKGALTSVGIPPMVASLIEAIAGGAGSFVLNLLSAFALNAPKENELPEGINIQRHNEAVAILDALVVHYTRGENGSSFYRTHKQAVDTWVEDASKAFETQKEQYYSESVSFWDRKIFSGSATEENNEPSP